MDSVPFERSDDPIPSETLANDSPIDFYGQERFFKVKMTDFHLEQIFLIFSPCYKGNDYGTLNEACIGESHLFRTKCGYFFIETMGFELNSSFPSS